jgi:hypothetical protein
MLSTEGRKAEKQSFSGSRLIALKKYGDQLLVKNLFNKRLISVFWKD